MPPCPDITEFWSRRYIKRDSCVGLLTSTPATVVVYLLPVDSVNEDCQNESDHWQAAADDGDQRQNDFVNPSLHVRSKHVTVPLNRFKQFTSLLSSLFFLTLILCKVIKQNILDVMQYGIMAYVVALFCRMCRWHIFLENRLLFGDVTRRTWCLIFWLTEWLH